MLKVKDGDFDKMGLLYERHHRQLYRFLFHMTKQKELSEDLVQNIFMRMLKYPDGFMGFGEFRTWMYHIARNTLFDHFRKESRKPASLDLREYEERIECDARSDKKIEKEQDIKMLEIAMQRLSEENRELLILCRFQEMKYNEIAAVLNTSEGAIKVRVHRAMAQLKNNFMNLRK
jgi:RNA polymerase sigma-70 factor (ECF subfamily)